jgi:hypothetical protein
LVLENLQRIRVLVGDYRWGIRTFAAAMINLAVEVKLRGKDVNDPSKLNGNQLSIVA